MSGISPAEVRDTLRRILGDELAQLSRLAGLLQAEHGFITANDIDELERASAARQDCVAQLGRLGEERRDLCRMLGKGADVAGLAALVAWCDPEGQLAPVHAEHAARSAACRAQNERNGALVGARMARIDGMLGMLTGNPRAPVYGRSGQRDPSPPSAGRLIAARA